MSATISTRAMVRCRPSSRLIHIPPSILATSPPHSNGYMKDVSHPHSQAHLNVSRKNTVSFSSSQANSSILASSLKKTRDSMSGRVHGNSVKSYSSKIAPTQTYSSSVNDADSSRKGTSFADDEEEQEWFHTPISILDKKKTLVLDVAYR